MQLLAVLAVLLVAAALLAVLRPEGTAGGRIAFSRVGAGAGLYEVDVRTGRIGRLTAGHDVAPAWNRQGTMLAFVRQVATVPQVMVKAGGGRPFQLGTGRSPTWDPTGTRLAFLTNGGLEIVEVASRRRAVIASFGRVTDVEQVAWSPRAERFAVALGTGVVEVWDRAGKPVLRAPAVRLAVDMDVAWGPDGGRLAFARLLASGKGIGSLLVLDSASRATRVIRRQPGFRFGSPVWSPDGSRLAFVRQSLASFPPDRAELFVSRSDGSKPRLLTPGGWNVGSAAWRPRSN